MGANFPLFNLHFTRGPKPQRHRRSLSPSFIVLLMFVYVNGFLIDIVMLFGLKKTFNNEYEMF